MLDAFFFGGGGAAGREGCPELQSEGSVPVGRDQSVDERGQINRPREVLARTLSEPRLQS